MTKWKYVRIRPPSNYPGKVYNSGLCLEHHYVWWTHTGEVVQKGFHIHHIDGNPENNMFENLEKLSASNHSRLHATKGISKVTLICPNCNSEFTRSKNQTHLIKKKQLRTFCSRSCGVSFNNSGG